MIAAVLHGSEDLRIEEVDRPTIEGPDEAIIRVEWAAICGTDVHAYEGRIPVKLPIVMGHEYSGEVIEVGQGVRGLGIGDKVVGLYGASCGSCEFCVSGRPQLCMRRLLFGLNINGSFAEYLRVPRAERTLVKVPEGMEMREAVLVPDMFQTALYSVETGGVGPGSRVLITGIGAIGLSILIAAKLAGASSVIAVDIRDRPLKLAKEMGADYIIDAREEGLVKRVREITGLGIDVAIDTSGAASVVKQAIEAVRPGGTHVQTGIVGKPVDLDLRYVTGLEKRILGVLCPASVEYLMRCLRIVNSFNLELHKLVTHELELREAKRALEIASKKIDDPIKVLLKIS